MDEESEESNDITKQEQVDCLVCFQPCKEVSVDLFLYSCKCIYPIHTDCFKEWRSVTGSSRVCVICREELDYADSDEEEEESAETTVATMIRNQRSIEERMEQIERSCMNMCCEYITKIMFLMFFGFIIAVVIDILRKKNLSSADKSN
jgi:hypothetical protein